MIMKLFLHFKYIFVDSVIWNLGIASKLLRGIYVERNELDIRGMTRWPLVGWSCGVGGVGATCRILCFCTYPDIRWGDALHVGGPCNLTPFQFPIPLEPHTTVITLHLGSWSHSSPSSPPALLPFYHIEALYLRASPFSPSPSDTFWLHLLISGLQPMIKYFNLSLSLHHGLSWPLGLTLSLEAKPMPGLIPLVLCPDTWVATGHLAHASSRHPMLIISGRGKSPTPRNNPSVCPGLLHWLSQSFPFHLQAPTLPYHSALWKLWRDNECFTKKSKTTRCELCELPPPQIVNSSPPLPSLSWAPLLPKEGVIFTNLCFGNHFPNLRREVNHCLPSS